MGDHAQLPQVFSSIVNPAVEYLGGKITSVTRSQVYGSPIRVFSRDWKVVFVHTAVQNRRYGASSQQFTMFLNLEDLGKRVPHQRDRKWGAACVSIVPKPEPIAEHVRPIVTIRFFFHLVIKCCKGRTRIATLIPLHEEGGNGLAGVGISAIRTL